MSGIAGIAGALLPLFGVVLLAWAVGGRVPRAAKLISGILVFVLIPPLVVDKVLQADATELMVIPPMIFAVAALMALPARWMAARVGDDFDPKLMSAGFSFFNVAFFGIPVASALFGEAAVSTIICAFVGSALYGDTIGYYLVARTKEGRRRAASKALRIPLFYAFVLAVVLKSSGAETPDALRPVADTLSTLVSVLGMAVIGFNLAQVKAGDVAFALLARIIAVRQIAAAVLVAAALAAEAALVGSLGTEQRVLIGLIGLFPIAANVSVYASLLGTQQREASVIVALSNALSLVLVVAAVSALAAIGLV